MLIKLGEWTIKEPSDAKCYTNQNEVVVVDKSRTVLTKIISVQDKILILIDDKTITIHPDSKAIEIR